MYNVLTKLNKVSTNMIREPCPANDTFYSGTMYTGKPWIIIRNFGSQIPTYYLSLTLFKCLFLTFIPFLSALFLLTVYLSRNMRAFKSPQILNGICWWINPFLRMFFSSSFPQLEHERAEFQQCVSFKGPNFIWSSPLSLSLFINA